MSSNVFWRRVFLERILKNGLNLPGDAHSRLTSEIYDKSTIGDEERYDYAMDSEDMLDKDTEFTEGDSYKSFINGRRLSYEEARKESAMLHDVATIYERTLGRLAQSTKDSLRCSKVWLTHADLDERAVLQHLYWTVCKLREMNAAAGRRRTRNQIWVQKRIQHYAKKAAEFVRNEGMHHITALNAAKVFTLARKEDSLGTFEIQERIEGIVGTQAYNEFCRGQSPDGTLNLACLDQPEKMICNRFLDYISTPETQRGPMILREKVHYFARKYC